MWNEELALSIDGISFSILWVIGVLKEGRDSYGHGNVELKVALATSLGGSLVLYPLQW